MGCPADLATPLRRGEGAVAIGVDVGTDAVTAIVTDGWGNVISSVERPAPRQYRADADRLAQEIGSTIQPLCVGPAGDLSTEVSEAAVLVVGVSVPGVVDEDERSARRSETLGLQDAPLVGPVRWSPSPQASGSPGLSGSLEVRLYQDAGYGAQTESRWGTAGRNCLYLAVGERISSAVLLGGASVLGEGWAGQVDRILVPDSDRSGERACLEDVTLACAMVRRHTVGMLDDSAALEPGGYESVSDELSIQCATRLESLSGVIVSGDREARRVWDTGLDCLAELIAQGVGPLGPLDVVVSSELTRADEAAFLKPLRGRVADLVGDLPAPRLVAIRLGATAPVLGAAGRALTDREQPDSNPNVASRLYALG